MGAFANPDGKAALPEGLEAEMLWHSGPEFHTKGKTLRLSFRLATEDDIKPHGKIKSRYLWLGGKGGRGGGRGKRRLRHVHSCSSDDGRDGHRDGRRDGRRDAVRDRRRATTRGREAQETERACAPSTTATTAASATFARSSRSTGRNAPRWAALDDAPMEATREPPARGAPSDAALEADVAAAPMR